MQPSTANSYIYHQLFGTGISSCSAYLARLRETPGYNKLKDASIQNTHMATVPAEQPEHPSS